MNLTSFLLISVYLLLFFLVYTLIRIFELLNPSQKLFKLKVFKLKWSSILNGVLLLIAVGFIVFSIFYSTTYFTNTINYSTLPKTTSIHEVEGQLGDKIGGLMNPFISIAAVIVTGLAFYAQYNANKLIKEQFKIEQFENKYYELLKIHKNNVSELDIANKIKGRKCFVPLFYELRCVYQIVNDFYVRENPTVKKAFEYEKINLMNFSYRIFFFGIGFNSEKLFVNRLSIGEEHLFNRIKPFLEKIQDSYLRYMKSHKDKQYYTYGLPYSGIPNEKTIEFYYFPFDGHQNKLGHYYRHLFQTMNFIVEEDLLDKIEKYKYVKTLRAQLSNFEQLMLYYNSLSFFEQEWHIFFTDYRLIKNLPIQLADFDQQPLVYFKEDIKRLAINGITMFEWLE